MGSSFQNQGYRTPDGRMVTREMRNSVNNLAIRYRQMQEMQEMSLSRRENSDHRQVQAAMQTLRENGLGHISNQIDELVELQSQDRDIPRLTTIQEAGNDRILQQ